MPRTDAHYTQPLTIAVSRFEWTAILEAVNAAAAKTREERFLKIIPGAKMKIEAALASGNMAIETAVHNWINLAELVLAFGNCYAKAGGRQIVVECSRVLHQKPNAEAV